MTKNIQTDILIIGGGISGLTATWQLQNTGDKTILLEARPRFGGRILTVGNEEGSDCDLGPSWIWPGQPLVASLLEHFNIPVYEQFSDGSVLFQEMDGHVEKTAILSPMAGALRIQGGINCLTDAITQQINSTHRFLSHKITSLSINEDMIYVEAIGPSGKVEVETKKVALAIPPRLASELIFKPELPAEAILKLKDTPTWMAGHGKFFATYDEPFWRQQGLCGTAISRCGPLAEIHDASPNSGSVYSLFGFSGLDATSRQSMGRSEFIRQATAQLATLFGEKSNHPKEVYFQDWSTETFTANVADLNSQIQHPQFGPDLQLSSAWDGKLEFISSETSYENGGLIEGAIDAGLRYSKRIKGELN